MVVTVRGLSAVRDGLVGVLSDAFPDIAVEREPVDNIYDRSIVVLGFAQSPLTFNDTKATTSVVVAVRRSPEHVRVLDELLDPLTGRSVKDVIEADPTLGGACSSVAVTSIGGYEAAELGGVTYLSSTLTVEVLF